MGYDDVACYGRQDIRTAAIDKGMKVSGVPCDSGGVARPQGPACDIGAYEFKADAAAPDSIPARPK
jgi:hypothetical protein